MTTVAPALAADGGVTADERFDAICDELAELCGQQNVIAGRIAELVAEVEADDLLGGRGLRSLEHFCTWQLGVSPGRARNIVAVARRSEELPVTTGLLRDGVLSEDQVAVIARRAPSETDEHFAEMARLNSVANLRRAVAMSATPEPDVHDEPAPVDRVENQVSVAWDDDGRWGCRIKLEAPLGAIADQALRSHLDALVAEWRRDREQSGDDVGVATPPFPTLADAVVRMAEHSLDAEAAARPHGHRTTVMLHLDVDEEIGLLHLGPALSEAERRYLSCDSKIEVWFERDGVPIGAGRSTRELPRRLRRALEFRHGGCSAVPGCGATKGLHAHHLRHWLDGGPTELENLVLVCPFHHRLHHAGGITISGSASALIVTDRHGRELTGASLARPPTKAPPPSPSGPYRHPTGEPFNWRWYDPPSLS